MLKENWIDIYLFLIFVYVVYYLLFMLLNIKQELNYKFVEFDIYFSLSQKIYKFMLIV